MMSASKKSNYKIFISDSYISWMLFTILSIFGYENQHHQFVRKLESFGNRELQLKNLLYQIGLWTYL